MITPLDNEVLQEYLNIPEDLDNYTKNELLEFNPEGACVISPSWSKDRIKEALSSKRDEFKSYIEMYGEDLNKFYVGMLMKTAVNNKEIYLIRNFDVNECHISFHLIELKLQEWGLNKDELSFRGFRMQFNPSFVPLDIENLNTNRMREFIKPALLKLLEQLN